MPDSNPFLFVQSPDYASPMMMGNFGVLSGQKPTTTPQNLTPEQQQLLQQQLLQQQQQQAQLQYAQKLQQWLGQNQNPAGASTAVSPMPPTIPRLPGQ